MAITQWALNWDRGTLVVQSLGAMIMPRFDLPDGRSISPLATPPWRSEPPTPGIPQGLQHMWGEWPCVPFGLAEPRLKVAPRWREVCHDRPDGPLHGPGSNEEWQLIDRGPAHLTLRIDYPAKHPIAWLERRLSVTNGLAAVDCDLSIMPRQDVALPIAFHPVVRLPSTPRSVRLRPGNFRFGLTGPYLIAPGGSVAGLDRRFTDLANITTETGRRVDLSCYPLEGRFEDVLQLVGTSGRMLIDNLEERYTLEVAWDPAVFPSCLVWISNAGITTPPWNSRHYAVGIEPACSAFDIGNQGSAEENPINREGERTCISFQSNQLWRTRYRLSIEALA
ncbi:MAG TPA: hypothetical protein VFL49_01280 [Pseudolabrys sp.]|nr:hypothetical protein [Pseudolabrys sp.]